MVNRASGNEGADTRVSEKVVYAAITAAAATATRIDAVRRICEAGDTAAAVTASPSRSMMNRAVERSATRRRRSLSRHPRSRATRAGDTVAGNAVQSGSPRSTAASVSEMPSPSNARRPVTISKSTHPKAQTSLRLSAARPLACSGLMYAAVPSITPTRVIMAGEVMVGDVVTSELPASADAVRAPSPSRSPAPSPCHRAAP